MKWHKYAPFMYGSPTPKILILGVVSLLMALILNRICFFINMLSLGLKLQVSINTMFVTAICILISAAIFISALLEKIFRSDAREMKYMIRRRLCNPAYGNPLNMKEGELIPRISVRKSGRNYDICITCRSAQYDVLDALESVISDCLIKKFKNFAVVAKDEDIAGNYVSYRVSDVVDEFNKQDAYYCIEDIPAHITKRYIRSDVFIDYTRVLNASALVAGRTRSGKTTAILLVFIIPILKLGKDNYGSTVTIVDPKTAELSLCPHVLSPRAEGDVSHIYNAVYEFNKTRIKRQKYINDYCTKTGKAAKWYDIGMKPSILFIDEFVSLQDLMPKKPSRDNSDYCLSGFQGLIRQIATQGASAGCFLIISTAEASVGVGGIETAVNNACGIRVLMKPCLKEAHYLWSSEQLDVMREHQYSAGDAWFSADDGINNDVRFVKCPRAEFGEYDELSRLLKDYYGD